IMTTKQNQIYKPPKSGCPFHDDPDTNKVKGSFCTGQSIYCPSIELSELHIVYLSKYIFIYLYNHFVGVILYKFKSIIDSIIKIHLILLKFMDYIAIKFIL